MEDVPTSRAEQTPREFFWPALEVCAVTSGRGAVQRTQRKITNQTSGGSVQQAADDDDIRRRTCTEATGVKKRASDDAASRARSDCTRTQAHTTHSLGQLDAIDDPRGVVWACGVGRTHCSLLCNLSRLTLTQLRLISSLDLRRTRQRRDY